MDINLKTSSRRAKNDFTNIGRGGEGTGGFFPSFFFLPQGNFYIVKPHPLKNAVLFSTVVFFLLLPTCKVQLKLWILDVHCQIK